MKRTLLFLFLLLLPQTLSAQPEGNWSTPYRGYTTADGLPHENVLALAQGADHRLYVGTLLGLAVYNGEQFQAVSFPDSIDGSAVHELVSGSGGTVWVSVGGQHLVEMQGRWVVRTHSIPGSVEALLVRRDTLYAFTGASGYWTLGPDQKDLVHHPYSFPWRLWRAPGDSTSARGIEDAVLSPTGTIWIVDGRRGPGRLQDDGTVSFAGVPEAEASRWWTQMRFVTPNTALLRRTDEVYRFHSGTGRIQRIVRAPGPLSTYRRSGATVFVKGNARWRLPSHTRLPGFSELGLPVRSTNRTLVDHEGSLWLGTRDGLFQLYARNVRHLRQIGDTALSNVGSFSVDADSVLWATSWGSGLLRVNPRPAVFQPAGENRWTRVTTHSGRVQSLSGVGWYRHDPERGWRRVAPFHEAVRGVVGRNGKGYFWHDDGLYRHTPHSKVPPDTLMQWATSHRDFAAVGMRQGGGFVLRNEDQLYRGRIDGAGASSSDPLLEPTATLPGYDRARGRSLAAGQDGVVWLAFWDRGLLRVDTQEDPAQLDSLLTDRPVRGIRLSGDSLVFVTSWDGLYVVDAESAQVVRHLTREDGLLGSSTGDAIVYDGALYVTHQHGLTRMPKELLQRDRAAPPVLLTSVERGDNELRPGAAPSFRARDRDVGFSFSAPAFQSPSRVRYEYRLSPIRTRWTERDRAYASYTNLPPGRYTFEVRARIGTGAVGPATAYTFRIPRHFYETTWFRLLLGLAVLALGIAAYRWRIRTLRRRKRELEHAVDDRTQQLRREKRTTEEQAERLAELDEAKNRFFANVSHEFRTPLTLITGPITDLLSGEHGPVTDAQARRLRMMRHNADRLLDLIEQVLDLARLDAGEMTLEARQGNLISFLRQRLRAFEPLAERNDVALHFRPDVDEYVTSYDPEKLRTVLDNLLSNALGFTPEGGDVWLSTRVRPQSSAVDIVVKDTGPGIAEDDMKSLFDRFEQRDDAASRPHEGAGIGLALARDLVELHGGSIRVRSEPGYGAAFIVRLPTDERELEEGGPPMDGSADGDFGSAGGNCKPGTEGGGGRKSHGDRSGPRSGSDSATILIVDDNEQVRMLLRDHLGHAYDLVEAAGGQEGLDAARAHQPDLIVSDVMMPHMDGFALCEAVKSDPDLAATPVLLLTAKAGAESEREGLQHGADAYVSKPFDPNLFRARVQNLIATRRRLKAAFGTRVLVESSGEAVSEETASLLEQVLEIVEEHLGDATFGVEDLAAGVALSRRQLSRRLKEATGESPGVLIRRVRLQHAVHLLEEDTRTISEVAFAVGYESPSHFARAFRKRFGCPPSEYEGAE